MVACVVIAAVYGVQLDAATIADSFYEECTVGVPAAAVDAADGVPTSSWVSAFVLAFAFDFVMQFAYAFAFAFVVVRKSAASAN